MLMPGLFILTILVALCWVSWDNNAIAAYEVLKKNLHSTARDMGMYREWLLQSTLRLALLLTLVAMGIVAAFSVLQHNPWSFGVRGKATLFATMLACSLALFAMPHLSAKLRLKSFLYFKATELEELVSIVSSNEGIRKNLEPAEMDAFDGTNGWSAWHPLDERWSEGPIWEGLVPLIYLHQDTETSFIIPVDFEHFLAWKLPEGSVTPGSLMPIRPNCSVMTVSELRGRKGWSVVQADIDIEEEAA